MEIPSEFTAGFLGDLDNRTNLAKVLRSNYNEIIEDLGGESDVSHIKASMVERFIWLEAVLHTLERDMATGKVPMSGSLGKWVQSVNSLTGLARVLGIERLSPSVTLSEYTAEKTNGESK